MKALVGAFNKERALVDSPLTALVKQCPACSPGHGHAEVVSLLLRHGARSLERRDREGLTPLLAAAAR